MVSTERDEIGDLTRGFNQMLEHKTIACYEAGEELTVANIRRHTRFHPMRNKTRYL